MTFLGHFLVDSGSSRLDNLHSTFEVTVPESRIEELKQFIEEKIIAEISKKEQWRRGYKTITLLIGYPSKFEEISELYSFLQKLNS